MNCDVCFLLCNFFVVVFLYWAFAWKWDLEEFICFCGSFLTWRHSLYSDLQLVYCVNDCSIRVGIMLLGGEGAAGADEHLKPLKFYSKIFAKLCILRGRKKLRSCIDWADWSLNHYFKCFSSWPISHQATVKLGTSCNCGARTVWCNLQGGINSSSQNYLIRILLE